MPAARLVLLAVLASLATAAPAAAIVGGTETQRSWPHMAALEVRDGDGFSFSCGGSLIRPDVVLTAAHCVDPENDDAAKFRVLLGTRDRASGGERIAASRIVEHPGYDASDKATHDVALIKLASPSRLGSPIRVAGPADAAAFEPGDGATILGWGATMSGGPSQRMLREGQVPIVSDRDCGDSYAVTGFEFDPATMICAGNLLGGEDSCQGDSGGPLMVPDAGGRFVLVGDTSFGFGCAFPTQYGVYGEVAGSTLRPWVEENAEALSPRTSSPGPGAGPTGPGSGSGGTPSLGTRLLLPRRLGSARRGRARRSTTIRVRSTGRVRRIRVSLRQRGRQVAAGRRARIRRSGRVVLRLRKGRTVRRGRATLKVTALDARGRKLRTSRRVRIRR